MRGDPLHFIFEAPGFRLGGSDTSDTIDLIQDPTLECLPCSPGASVDLDGIYGPLLGSGLLTFDDATSPPARAYYAGSLEFVTGAAVPAAAGTIRAPFMFTGRLSAFTDASRSGVPFFTRSLMGRGTFSWTLGIDQQGRLFSEEYLYSFEPMSHPAPTPEPMTLLLVGTGLAATGFRRFRSTRA